MCRPRPFLDGEPSHRYGNGVRIDRDPVDGYRTVEVPRDSLTRTYFRMGGSTKNPTTVNRAKKITTPKRFSLCEAVRYLYKSP